MLACPPFLILKRDQVSLKSSQAMLGCGENTLLSRVGGENGFVPNNDVNECSGAGDS